MNTLIFMNIPVRRESKKLTSTSVISSRDDKTHNLSFFACSGWKEIRVGSAQLSESLRRMGPLQTFEMQGSFR